MREQETKNKEIVFENERKASSRPNLEPVENECEFHSLTVGKEVKSRISRLEVSQVQRWRKPALKLQNYNFKPRPSDIKWGNKYKNIRKTARNTIYFQIKR